MRVASPSREPIVPKFWAHSSTAICSCSLLIQSKYIRQGKVDLQAYTPLQRRRRSSEYMGLRVELMAVVGARSLIGRRESRDRPLIPL